VGPAEAGEAQANPLYLLQQALELSVAAEPLEKRLRVDGVRAGRIHAIGPLQQIDEAESIALLNPDEAALLRRYDALVMSLIHVDDFAPDELGTRSGSAVP
jgi:hypothetical protein